MKRINSIDIFKILSSFGIVFFHTMFYGISLFLSSRVSDFTGTTKYMYIALVFIRPMFQWLMPAMYMISGYFLLRKNVLADLKKYYKINVLYVLLSIVFALILHFIKYCVDGKIMLFMHDFLTNKLGFNSLWFIYNLLLMYILAPLIYALLNKFSSRLLILIICLLLILCLIEGFCYNDFVCVSIRTIIYIFQFMIGYYIPVLCKILDKKKFFIFNLLIVILIFLFIAFMVYYVIILKSDYRSPIYYLCANIKSHSIFSTIIAMFFTPLIFNIDIKLRVPFASLLLLLVYVLHPFVIELLGKFLNYESVTFYLINIIINYVLTYAISILLIYVIMLAKGKSYVKEKHKKK